MKHWIRIIVWVSIGFIVSDCMGEEAAGLRISKPGQYEGYSEPLYDRWQRSSVYVTVRDGTRLAVDLFRPMRRGRVHQEPLPVVWEHRRYQRASQDDTGRVSSQLDRDDHPMRKVVLYGYVYAVVAVRGSGASFGSRIDPTPPQESLDAYDVTEWLAAQSWCNGNVGMYGISYSGTVQFMAASTAPPHLKAIFPEMAMFDLYDLGYPGGIYRPSLMQNWARQIQDLDLFRQRTPALVDPQAPEDLSRALQDHQVNFDVSLAANAPYRDSVINGAGPVYQTHTPASVIDQVNQSGVAVYQRAGWFDMYPRDMLLWFNNLTVSKKIVIGPWNHYQSQGLDRAVEMLRWYDYWLKGVENGIMEEPPILYGVNGRPINEAIRWARQWPPQDTEAVSYFLAAGPSGSVDSVNDGLLGLSLVAGQDRYRVDYTTTSGSKTRWTGRGVPAYPDMTPNDRKALTYTTTPLVQDVELVGHPVIHLWIQCSANDLDVFAYLEEVDANGHSTYVTEGCLRASHRSLADPSYNRMGLPYHPSGSEDRVSLGHDPVELVFDLYPTANFFEAGHRIRLALTCADLGNHRTPQLTPAPNLTVYRNTERPSRILLPIRKAQ